MNPNPPIDILPLIRDWVTLKLLEINTVVKIPGGWELWAQTDISILLRKSPNYTETRSPACYTQSGKADHRIRRTGYQDAIVELKVYNEATETAEAFALRVLKDEEKIRTKGRAPGFENNAFWSIGIALASHAEQTTILNALQATHQGSIVHDSADESLIIWHHAR